MTSFSRGKLIGCADTPAMRFHESYRLSYFKAAAVLFTGALLLSGCIASGAVEEPAFRSSSASQTPSQLDPTYILHLKDGSVIVARKEARMRTEDQILTCYGMRYAFLRDTSSEGVWRVPVDSIAGFSYVRIAEDRRQLGSMLLISTWMFFFGAMIGVAAAL